MQFQYGVYNSPAPAFLIRVKPSLVPMIDVPAVVPHARNLRKYRVDQYFTIVVTSALARGAVGRGHRAKLEIAVKGDRTLTYDAVVKLAFTPKQQQRLRYEYYIYKRLAHANIAGVPVILGLFTPSDGGPLIMLSNYCGTDLSLQQIEQGSVNVQPHQR